MLVEHFVESVCNDYGRSVKKVQPDAIKLLQEQDWTGNIRELRNVIERLIILSDVEITLSDVQNYVSPTMQRFNQISSLVAQFDSLDSMLEEIKAEWGKRMKG